MSIVFAKMAENIVIISSIVFDMAAPREFVGWLNSSIVDRGWSIRELADVSGVSRTTISNIISAGEEPSFDTCVKLADAFNKPRAEVIVLAGLLPAPPAYDPEVEELMHLFRQLKGSDKREMIEIAQLKLKRLKADSEGAERVKRGDSKAK